MQQEFYTVWQYARVQTEEKKSKFIAYVKPILAEAEALAFIEHIRQTHWDATHNCYAYDCFGESHIQRFSDDGEPQGTAGLPILEVLRKSGLRNVVVVVTRYFGGIMLGAGGLVRAYGKSAAEGIAHAIPVRQVYCSLVEIRTDYKTAGKLQNFAMTRGIAMADIQYSEEVVLSFVVPNVETEAFFHQVQDLTNARALLHTSSREYRCFDGQGKLMEKEKA